MKANWTRFITDTTGAPAVGASVTVFQSDGITPATIYSTSGGAAKSNPFLTPAGGKAEFYADPGVYVIQAAKDGQTAVWNDEEIGMARRDNDLSDLESAATARTNLGLGSASLLDATQSTTDSTAGRAIRTGDAGVLGPTPLLPVNMDSFDIPGGNYFTNNGTEGTFPSGAKFGILTASHVGGDIQQQTWRRGDTANLDVANTLYIRTGYAGVVNQWSAWRKVFHEGNIVGTVTESGGIPTGAIMQYVTSGTNKAAKYADGLLLTWNDNAIITADPVAYVGTATSLESGKFKIGRWY